jgi:Bacterial extracellular solute-binding protein/von Willebrand factor type A domain
VLITKIVTSVHRVGRSDSEVDPEDVTLAGQPGHSPAHSRQHETRKRDEALVTPLAVRRVVVAFAVLATAVLVIVTRPIHMTAYISTDAWDPVKDRILNQAVADFNEEQPVRMGLRPVVIDVVAIPSGDAELALKDDPGAAEIWIPASAMWGELLNQVTQQVSLAPADAPRLMYSTQVFAMWRHDVDRLRLTAGMSWSDVERFVDDPMSWGDPAHPFRMVHTNPFLSTSGLTAAFSECFAGSDGTQKIDEGCVRSIQTIEEAIVHYGDTVTELMEQLACHGESFASLMYVQKQSIEQFQQRAYEPPVGARCERPDPRSLVAVPTSDGVRQADYPCYALDAPTSDPDRVAAASHVCGWFSDWTTGHQDVLRSFFFDRSADPRAAAPPSGRFLDDVQGAWEQHRKLADVMLDIDLATSDETLAQVKADTYTCLGDTFLDSDRIGLVSSQARTTVPLGGKEAVQDAIQDLTPGGSNRLWDSIAEAIHELRRGGGAQDRRIHAVVVFTDGTDAQDSSKAGPDDLIDLVGQGLPVQVWAVTYGTSAARDRNLAAVTTTSQGRIVVGNDTNCDEIFDRF